MSWGVLTQLTPDVVPVLNDTRGMWSHDPYGGDYEEATDKVWGRGSTDDKSGTIGILAAIELLLESGKFEPKRSIVVALGIDEETGGKVGATNLGYWLVDKYGKDSMAMIVDEGSGIDEVLGQVYAMPAVVEKGYLDVELRVETLGGHSSVPPPHTGIGYTAMAIAALEKHPHKPYLQPDSPMVTLCICLADSAPEASKDLKKAARKVQDSLTKDASKVDKKALKDLEDWWVYGSEKDKVFKPGMGRAMVSTTQAIDIIGGGLKVNALPEVVTTYVNHRISTASSVKELQGQLIDVLGPVAKENKLELHAFGKNVDLTSYGCPHMDVAKASAGKLILSEAFNSSIDPARISPHKVDSPHWRLLSGAVKGVWQTRPTKNIDGRSEDVWMAPSSTTGVSHTLASSETVVWHRTDMQNTDTKRYWGLTSNIYRFGYLSLGGKSLNNAHTVDEYMVSCWMESQPTLTGAARQRIHRAGQVVHESDGPRR